MSRNLPAALWSRIAARVLANNLGALRLTSREARRGAEQQYLRHRKARALGRAYTTATARTVRPLVAALRREPPPDPANVVQQGGTRHQMDVMVGRYRLDVMHVNAYATVRWVQRPAPGSMRVTTVGMHHATDNTLSTFPDFRTLGPGGVTLGRLVKAAFKAAFPPA